MKEKLLNDIHNLTQMIKTEWPYTVPTFRELNPMRWIRSRYTRIRIAMLAAASGMLLAAAAVRRSKHRQPRDNR